MKKYNSFLGAFFSGDNGQGGYNAAYGKSALAKLAMPDIDEQTRSEAIGGLARVDPATAMQFTQQQQKAAQERQMAQARMLAAAPVGERPKLYAAILPGLKKDWAEAPDIYTSELDSMVQAWAGNSGQQTQDPADIRTNQWYLKQLGYKPGSKEEQDFLRMRAGQIPKAVPYGFKYDEQGNVWVEDKNQGEIRPGQFGGQNPPPQAGGVAIGNPVAVQTDNEAPVDFSTLPADEQRALALASQAASQGKPFHYTVKGGVVAPATPQQARIGVNPPEPKPATWNAPVVETRGGKQVRVRYGTQDGQPIEQVMGEAEPDPASSAKLTDDMRKTSTLLSRMEFALKQVQDVEAKDPEANRPGYGTYALDMLPEPIGNSLKSAGRQQIEAAQLDALDAALTLATGAAYTKEQLFGLRKAYFPQPNDDESTIRAKAERFKNVIESARVRAGSASQQAQPAKQGQPVRIRNTDDYNRLPSGARYIDPNGTLRVKK